MEITRIFHLRNWIEKTTWKQRGFFDQRNCIKKVRGNNVDHSTSVITSTKVRGNNEDFSTIEIMSKKYVKITWIFQPAKLHQKKYVETTWIFRPSKLRRKSAWKRRGNSAKFGLRRIDVISTSNRRRFDVVCPLGVRLINNF